MTVDATILARAAWSRLTEPGDEVAGALIGALGPVEALAWLRESGPDADGGPDLTALAPAMPVLPEAGGRYSAVARLSRAAARWAPRLVGLDPRRELRVLERLGGRLLTPEQPGWPTALDDLGPGAPPCLWVRGTVDLAAALHRSVALIGARACTAYGEHVTAELGAGLAAKGWAVVSGGAYGIDAVAHRAVLAVDGPTVAFLAGGVDRLYPAGNARLLSAVIERSGAVVSEVPPGSVPSKTRFLQRNRLIAAGGRATVVVEAAWRSGALNTAGHASALLRPVGAVPGPVTSVASAGCHRLLRSGAAVCVTDVDEVLDLAGVVGDDLAAQPEVPERAWDRLSAEARSALDALPVRRGAEVDALARSAGLTVEETRAALGVLELDGLAVRESGTWRRRPVATPTSGQNRTYHPPRRARNAGTG